MTLTPGDLARRVPRWVWVLAVLAPAASAVWYATHHLSELQRTKIAEATAWKIEGPACPPLAPAEFLKGRKRAPRYFAYEGVRFYRRSGYVDCAAIYYDGGRSDRFYPVCQFTSPGQVMVRTKKGEWYFDPGVGQPATVSTPHDEARCVMASRVTLGTVRAQRAAGVQ